MIMVGNYTMIMLLHHKQKEIRCQNTEKIGDKEAGHLRSGKDGSNKVGSS